MNTNCEAVCGLDAIANRHVECTPGANGEMRQARCLPAKSRAHRTPEGEKMGYVYGPLPPFTTLQVTEFPANYILVQHDSIHSYSVDASVILASAHACCLMEWIDE